MFFNFQATHTVVDDWETRETSLRQSFRPSQAEFTLSGVRSVSRSRSQTHTGQTDSQTDGNGTGQTRDTIDWRQESKEMQAVLLLCCGVLCCGCCVCVKHPKKGQTWII